MEKLMQYVWQHRLLPAGRLTTVDGRRVCIINPGTLNTAAGPDFFNATIQIDDDYLVGNVEIHVRASDWHRHGHDDDPAYDSVVLHVVDRDDTPIRRRNGHIIPQMVMQCSPALNAEYHNLTDTAAADLPCSSVIASMPGIYVTDWVTSLAFERLHDKVHRVADILAECHDDWEQTAFILIARSLGFGLNNDAFERLARALPLSVLRKHSDQSVAVEAMLLHTSGLPLTGNDPYITYLRSEADFYAAKFSLRNLDSQAWRLSGVRPQSLPYRRIALLASLVCTYPSLMWRLRSTDSIDPLRQIFTDIAISPYWATHYMPGGLQYNPLNTLSKSSADIIIINAVIPLIYAYGEIHGDDTLCESAIAMLQILPAEANSIIRLFNIAGVKCRDAFTSQALVQLRREYCQKRKCLYCRIGHRHLSSLSLR